MTGNTLTSEPFSSRKTRAVGEPSRHEACHLSGGACPGTEAVLTAALAMCQRLAPAVLSDKENIAGLCDLVGSLIRPPLCHDDEKAMIVLRRPGSATISQADGYIFRLVRQAAVDRETAPWAFYLVGPDGIREVTEDEGQ